MSVHVVWDGGAEGTTISQACASELLRKQHALPPDQRPLVDLGRQPAQKFFGFSSDRDSPIIVDVQGYLTLEKDGQALPELISRVVEGQHDDMLVAALDLDRLGWNATPEYFSLAACGIAIPRTANVIARHTFVQELSEQGVSVLRVRDSVVVHPFEELVLGTERVGRCDGRLAWVSPSPQLSRSGLRML
jgi:hypothetical protein